MRLVTVADRDHLEMEPADLLQAAMIAQRRASESEGVPLHLRSMLSSSAALIEHYLDRG